MNIENGSEHAGFIEIYWWSNDVGCFMDDAGKLGSLQKNSAGTSPIELGDFGRHDGLVVHLGSFFISLGNSHEIWRFSRKSGVL